jgi:hypothetical protein
VRLLERRVAALEAASGGNSGGCERCRGVLTVIRSTETGALYSASWNGGAISEDELGEREAGAQCPKCGRDLAGDESATIKVGGHKAMRGAE